MLDVATSLRLSSSPSFFSEVSSVFLCVLVRFLNGMSFIDLTFPCFASDRIKFFLERRPYQVSILGVVTIRVTSEQRSINRRRLSATAERTRFSVSDGIFQTFHPSTFTHISRRRRAHAALAVHVPMPRSPGVKRRLISLLHWSATNSDE